MAERRVRRVRRSEDEWREILSRLERSDLGVTAFCRKERISAESLRRWRKRLEERTSSRFVEVLPAAFPGAQGSWELELDLPGGGRLRLRG